MNLKIVYEQNTLSKIIICLIKIEYFTRMLPSNNKKNQSLETYLVKYDFKLIYDKEFTPHIESELQSNITIFQSKKFFYFGLNFLLKEDKKLFAYVKCVLQPLVPLDT